MRAHVDRRYFQEEISRSNGFRTAEKTKYDRSASLRAPRGQDAVIIEVLLRKLRKESKRRKDRHSSDLALMDKDTPVSVVYHRNAEAEMRDSSMEQRLVFTTPFYSTCSPWKWTAHLAKRERPCADG